MSATRVELSPRFLKELERLERKYPRSIDEVSKLVEQLKTDERPGGKIPRVGHDVYKVRLTNPAAGRGKRGGFRTIYYIRTADHIFLLTIYSKTTKEDVKPEDIRRMISDLPPVDDNKPDSDDSE